MSALYKPDWLAGRARTRDGRSGLCLQTNHRRQAESQSLSQLLRGDQWISWRVRVAVDPTTKHVCPAAVDHTLISHWAQTGADLNDYAVLNPNRVGGNDGRAVEDPDTLKKKQVGRAHG